MNHIAPLLSRLVPIYYAVEGIKKVNPRVGNFLQSAASVGYTSDEALDFLRNKIGDSSSQSSENELRRKRDSGNIRSDQRATLSEMEREGSWKKALPVAAGLAAGTKAALNTKKQAPSSGNPIDQPEEMAIQENIIQKRSPPLHETILQYINQGRSPEQAGALARSNKNFGRIIGDIEREAGLPFGNLVAQVYQGSQQPADHPQQQPLPQSQQSRQPSPDMQALLQAIQQYRGRGQ